MARSYLFAFFAAAVLAVISWASTASAIICRVVEGALSQAFPVTAPTAPVSPSLAAPLVIGLAETRTYEARRERRVASDLSFGCGLRIAA